MRKASADPRPPGFSLMEVLIAQALLSIGLLSVAQLFGAAVWHGSRARTESLAITLAQQKMETLAAQYAAGRAPLGGEDIIRVDKLDDTGGSSHVLVMFRIVWMVQPQPRGAYTLQVKLIPWPGSARPSPGAGRGPVMIFRAGLVPLRR